MVAAGSATRERGGDQTKPTTTTTMTYEEVKSAYVQGTEREACEILNQVLRKCARDAFWHLMEEEVESLCGSRYHPDPEASCRRAGSEVGNVYLDGEKTTIRRPRVRDEEQGEVRLETWRAASSQQGLFEEVVSLVGEGMSQRGVERASGSKVSKSSISRMWVEKSREQLAQIRERDLSQDDWLVVMIDGVFPSKDNCVLVALGIDSGGRKQMLDFECGTTESAQVVQRLIGRLQKRGVSPSKDRRLLVVRDGSSAIRSAVHRYWPAALQQTCIIHIERNLCDRLRRQDRSECSRLFRLLRQAQGKQASEEAFEDLREFVAERNAASALTLTDSRNEMLCLQRLEVPSTLNVTLLSTNCIENVFRNWREHTNNIKRWDVKQDMLERWTASGLLWAEGGFRRIRHYEDLHHLKQALERPVGDSVPDSVATAPESSTPSPTVEGNNEPSIEIES